MKSIVDAPEADGKKYGLDKPAATVKFGSGSSQATLVIGGAAGEGSVYARDASRPAIFTVESSVLDELKKDGTLKDTTIQVDFVDDAGTPSTGVAAVQQVVNSDASVVIGPFLSSVTLATAPVL